VGDVGAILDYNVRALAKGQPEPYVSQPILERASALGLRIAPGDDSHGVDGVGVGLDEGIRRLRSAGFGSDWPDPG
jgi:histidinol-phosphatase (PHP family)